MTKNFWKIRNFLIFMYRVKVRDQQNEKKETKNTQFFSLRCHAGL